MATPKQATALQPGLRFADWFASLGLAGVLLCFVPGALLAFADLVFGQSPSLVAALFAPTAHQGLIRTAAAATVLAGMLVFQIVSDRRREVEATLAAESDRIYQMYAHSPECILCLDRDLVIVHANPAADRFFSNRVLTGTLVGRKCCDVLWPQGQAGGCLGREVLERAETCERTVHDIRDGTECWFEEVVYPAFDENGEIEQLIEIVRDVTEQVSAQRTVLRMAYHDPLTNLPNRVLFQDRFANALIHAKRRDEILAVCCIDIDQFKSINDGLGHSVGDAVLKESAAALLGLLRDEDTIARLGGDEFTVVARVAAREDADLLAERILGVLRRDAEIGGHQIALSASMGVATFPHDGISGTDLLKNADAALSRAKQIGHNTFRLYTLEMSRSAEDSLRLEMHLSHALDRGEFELHYQPQIDSRTGRAVGVEALIRWNHPVDGQLEPAAFIEFAEQAGFMGEIGPWVLRTACQQAREWLEEGIDFGRMAVNLSAREFEQYDVVETVLHTLRDAGLPPRRLEIEITETTAMRSADSIIDTLRQLQRLGVRVAIDDFGTGYSSMNYLKRFPLQTLKIPQAFLRDVHTDVQSGAITTMLIALCRELGLDIVAEGVEKPRELEFLRKQGCFIIQGFIYSAPLPADQARELLGRVAKPLANRA